MKYSLRRKKINFELKPCPFCGGEADFFEDEFFCRYSVVCTECGAETDTYGDERDAMDAWNKRVEHRDTKQQERKAYE